MTTKSRYNRRKDLKYRCFERDGWQDDFGKWFVLCAFGCGETLDWSTVTLDRYPLMGKDGGEYVLDNVRPACRACNSRNRNHKILTSRERKRAELRAANEAKWRDPVFLAKRAESLRSRRYNERCKQIKEELASFAPKGYPKDVKDQLRENYPMSRYIDRNGVPL